MSETDDENRAQRAEVDASCVEANLRETSEKPSPSGRFRIVVGSYATAPGTWSYSRITVYRVADGAVVADLCRCYDGFHGAIVVKNGREWLISGRSYMSQTIVDLESGAEYEPPGDHYDGHAFCWGHPQLSPDGLTLAVNGCHWACPWEWRFYDFTDPSKGWPELALPEIFDQNDGRFVGDRFELSSTTDGEIAERVVLRRVGDAMEVSERFVSDVERARRDLIERNELAFRAFVAEFKAGDPLYAAMRRGIERHALPDDAMIGWRTPDGEREANKHFRRKDAACFSSERASADLRWRVESGPIEVQLYDPSGNRSERLELPATIEGMDEAMAIIGRAFGASE